MKSYKEAEEYILSIPKFAGRHTLMDTKRLLGRVIGSGIKSKIIHIAGTNGKGSVCAYLRSVPLAGGCSVAMVSAIRLRK